MSNLRKRTGFTLIELLIVVAIIGIIAAIAIPNLLNAIDRGKQKRTMADTRAIGTAVESYAVDTNFYPISSSMASISSLGAANLGIEPIYLKLVPTKDGWGGLLYYGSDAGGAGSDYTLVSYGKDKKVSSSSKGETNDFDCDIIYQNGVFTAYPQGVQT
ncbi:MAG TPA: prepilin-type N-terminal cleavage/methylation domain-containing protein [Patescibacteria group bacterium]|jgi:type II secretion system protein G|nr:prepilin-type N-terminal cleavage/methylation domain-containing protein [Patescibacteria group bacterium]